MVFSWINVNLICNHWYLFYVLDILYALVMSQINWVVKYPLLTIAFAFGICFTRRIDWQLFKFFIQRPASEGLFSLLDPLKVWLSLSVGVRRGWGCTGSGVGPVRPRGRRGWRRHWVTSFKTLCVRKLYFNFEKLSKLRFSKSGQKQSQFDHRALQFLDVRFDRALASNFRNFQMWREKFYLVSLVMGECSHSNTWHRMQIWANFHINTLPTFICVFMHMGKYEYTDVFYVFLKYVYKFPYIFDLLEYV